MDYIVVNSIETGAPALSNKLTGEQTRASTLKTLAAGDRVPADMDKADVERLLALGAIAPVVDRPVSAVASVEAETAAAREKARIEAEAESAEKARTAAASESASLAKGAPDGAAKAKADSDAAALRAIRPKAG